MNDIDKIKKQIEEVHNHYIRPRTESSSMAEDFLVQRRLAELQRELAIAETVNETTVRYRDFEAMSDAKRSYTIYRQNAEILAILRNGGE